MNSTGFFLVLRYEELCFNSCYSLLMQKVLIISYFFPPCNLTASQRALSWARYLKKSGYQPVILTRRWDIPVNTLKDISKSTPGGMLVESNEDYQVYYLPYRSNLRDKIYIKYGEQRFSGFRKTLSLLELLLQNFWTTVIPYSNIFLMLRNLFERIMQ
jgi:hypothetical protein